MIQKDKFLVNPDSVDISRYEHMLLRTNEEYFSEPVNRPKELLGLIEDAKAAAYEEATKKGLNMKDPMIYEGWYRTATRRAIAEYSAEHRHEACPVETKQIKHTLALFIHQYDVNDPRAYMIICSVVSNQLTAIRLERYSSISGPVQTSIDKYGNTRVYLSPIEEAKRRFYESIVDAVAKLDVIFEGNKSQVVTTNYAPKDFAALFPHIDTEVIRTKTINKINK
jgi:hypothetical protein